MKRKASGTILEAAVRAAREAGELMRRNLNRPKRVQQATAHDIKLELDLRCQRMIGRALRAALPEAAVIGEEEGIGDPSSPWRWVVDPIDGTVNFHYGIPHACVSIALQEAGESRKSPAGAAYEDGYETRLGVVFDPFTDELWTAVAGQPARLNGRVIRVSDHRRLEESVIAVGFAKHRRWLEWMLPIFEHLAHRVRKIRMTGSAALALTYVASGRMDGYIESGVKLWDIAAGGLIVQQAGGVFWRRRIGDTGGFEMVASVEPLQRPLHRLRTSKSK
jgi:myo-inositol-1(or 4)-monophosphatase